MEKIDLDEKLKKLDLESDLLNIFKSIVVMVKDIDERLKKIESKEKKCPKCGCALSPYRTRCNEFYNEDVYNYICPLCENVYRWNFRGLKKRAVEELGMNWEEYKKENGL
jgi:hypothetical protein